MSHTFHIPYRPNWLYTDLYWTRTAWAYTIMHWPFSITLMIPLHDTTT